ncbi:hypothetical protein BGX27_007216, partial [Mortierella sp. AM989]
MAKKFGLLLHESALAQLGIKTTLAKKGEDHAIVSRVILFGAGVDKNIIEANGSLFVQDWVENLEHH